MSICAQSPKNTSFSPTSRVCLCLFFNDASGAVQIEANMIGKTLGCGPNKGRDGTDGKRTSTTLEF